MTVLKKKIVKKKTTKKKVVKKKTAKKKGPGKGAALKKMAKEIANNKKTCSPINTPENYVFGRPAEYDRSYPKKVYDACVTGECLTLASICCMLEICRDTLYDWVKKYPDFSYAIKKGTEFRKAFMEEKGMSGMHKGKSFNAVPWLFLTKNMFPDEYKDRQEVSLGNKQDEKFSFAFDLNNKPTDEK